MKKLNNNCPQLSLFCVLAVSLITPARAADTSLWVVNKHQYFNQNNAGPAVIQEENGGSYIFEVGVNGNAPGDVLGASVKLPDSISQAVPTNTDGTIGFDLTPSFSTLSALEAAYPPGQYVVTISNANDGIKVVTNNLPASIYPPAPHVSNFNAAQAINPLANFALTWDPFTNGTAGDWIQLKVNDADGNTVFISPNLGAGGALNGLSNSVVIPAGALTANGTYSANLTFDKIINLDTTSYPGATGVTVFWMKTFFDLETTNPPGVFPIATNSAVIEYGDGIAFDGTNYLVDMLTGPNASEVSNVVVQLVSASGALLGSQIVVGGGASLSSAAGLAFGQTNYLVAWSDATISSGVDMFGQFISRAGAKVGSAFNLLQSQGSFGFQTLTGVASDGKNFLTVWQDGSSRNFYGQLVSPSGTLSGSDFLISSQLGNGESAAVTFGKTNYLVVWQSNNGNAGDMNQTFGEFVSRNGSTGGPFQIGETASTDQGFLAVAFGGANYLVVWPWDPGPETEENVTNWQIYGRLVSQTGAFPGSELVLTTNRDQVIPSLAFDGSNYLLTYGYDSNTTNSDANLVCEFLDPSGGALGVPFTPFAAQGTNLPLFALNGILFDGTRYVIAGTVGSLGGSGQVLGAFIPASTTPPILAPTGPRAGTDFPLLLTGTPGINYAIQASTNLALNGWTAIVTNSPTNGPFSFTDTNAANTSRFYRAVKQ